MNLRDIYDRIEARRLALGLSELEVGERAGKKDAVRNIRRRLETNPEGSANLSTIRALADALGTTAQWLVEGSSEFTASDGSIRKAGYSPPPEILGAADLPVYAAAEGGPGEMVVSTDPIDVVPRPWFLKQVKEGYAVLVIGDSMEPAFEAGQMALVNPRLPALRGKDAIFVANEQHGEFRATIKRLVQSTTGDWLVKQFNPPKEFKLSKQEWPKALRVVGKYDGG